MAISVHFVEQQFNKSMAVILVTTSQGPSLDKAARLAININEVGDADFAIRKLEWEDFLAVIRRDEESRSLLADARILILTSWPSVAIGPWRLLQSILWFVCRRGVVN